MAIVTNSKRDGYCLAKALERCRNSRSFQHLDDKTILGFMCFHMELRVAGHRARDEFIPSHSITSKCKKCNGRGWFGRGRPKCSECDGQKQATYHFADRWVSKKRANLFGNWVREAVMNVKLEYCDEHHNKTKDKRLRRMFDCLHNSKRVYPAWVDNLRLKNHHDISEADALKKVRDAMTFRQQEILLRHDLLDWHEMIHCFSDNGNTWLIDLPNLMQRLALSFGVTCPITGERFSPENLRFCGIESRRYFLDDSLPDHWWGLEWNWEWKDFGRRGRAIYSLSEKGQKILERARRKWSRDFDGDAPDEWLIAEIMQRQLIPQAQLQAA